MRPRNRAVCLVLLALLVRFECGLHSYSGQATPPKFGDYEAQRHWMEVAVGTPASLWYTNTTDNDLNYWGLDYPPLSGYQSWLYGKVIQYIEPRAVALHASRGFESPTSKTLMRWTVVFSDLVCFLPSAWGAANLFGGHAHGKQIVLAALLLNPAQLVIDHGHFQYNGISLGLAAGAAAAIVARQHILGSVLYCLSLNHKQMSLYYAPAFFAYLLASSLCRPAFGAKILSVGKLSITVILTFAFLWIPYFQNFDAVLNVVQRIFPTKRGLYEDYVANFWCVSSLAVKWKQFLTKPQLVRATTLTTAAAFLPSMIFQLRGLGCRRLLITMALSSFAFYQFSYQVHEKSILLPLLPLNMMASSDLLLASWTTLVAVFSMGPLLVKDGLIVAAATLSAIYALILHANGARTRSCAKLQCPRLVLIASSCGMAFLACLSKACKAPVRWPYLWDAAIVSWSYLHFATAFLYLYTKY